MKKMVEKKEDGKYLGIKKNRLHNMEVNRKNLQGEKFKKKIMYRWNKKFK